MSSRFIDAVLLGLVLVAASPRCALAQGQVGPMKPPPPPGPSVRIPTKPEKPEPLPMLPDEMIKRFAAKEDEFARARDSYMFLKSVRLEEIGDDGKPAGQAEIVTQPVTGSDGQHYERVVRQASSTLHVLRFEPEDLQAIAAIPQFPLTTSQLEKYFITYQGKEPVDELNTYIFAVKPRMLDRTHAYFSGIVWVDDDSLAIVKTYGKWVTEIGDITSPQLPFTTFETYRQPVGKDDWFPAYSRSDDTANVGKTHIPIRLIIRWTDYTPRSSPPPAAPAKQPGQPAAPQS